jgi:hypothetical protein
MASAPERIDVKPGVGRLVRWANGQKVKAAGERVIRTPLVDRWLANGDLVLAPELAAAKATPAPAKAAPTATETGAKL